MKNHDSKIIMKNFKTKMIFFSKSELKLKMKNFLSVSESSWRKT